ncbi:cellulose-binding domain-containing protein, partial [Actinoplanes sp. KI2]|uniref:cellulose-binding domain-containing protein n=1 Tax=Actinoplanes sp. KI2 TaxID=2983315 RepID=UPI0021D5E872
DVFFDDGDVPPTSCRVTYRVNTVAAAGGFGVTMSITNTGSTPIPAWKLRFVFANGQRITDFWGSIVAQDGARVTMTNAPWNAAIGPGQTLSSIGFNAARSGRNKRPAAFSVNTTACRAGKRSDEGS